MRQSADASAVEQLIRDASDQELCRVNVLDFAAKRRLDEERAIATFLHAARLGLFELSWNVLCAAMSARKDPRYGVRQAPVRNSG